MKNIKLKPMNEPPEIKEYVTPCYKYSPVVVVLCFERLNLWTYRKSPKKMGWHDGSAYCTEFQLRGAKGWCFQHDVISSFEIGEEK